MSVEWNDTQDILTTKRYFKRHKMVDKTTNLPVEYKVFLDYDFYDIHGKFKILGNPLQIYTEDVLGDHNKDTRILVREEEMPLSHLDDFNGGTYRFDGQLHWKFPNV